MNCVLPKAELVSVWTQHHSQVPRLRDSKKFSPSGKGPQCHKFCFYKEILIFFKKKKPARLPWQQSICDHEAGGIL